MESENSENNKSNAEDVSDAEDDNKFHYNFINTPWDDRSDRSKVGVIAVLAAIAAATTALVVNNLCIHYRGFNSHSFYSNYEIDCNAVKVEDYPYVARLHLISSNELVCVGAVLSRYSVLANELCLRSGPIRLRIGSPIEPRCKKGFRINLAESIPHEGVITKYLVVLSIVENMGDCMSTIKIGLKFDPKKQLYIIGRSFHGGRLLSYQLANYSAGKVSVLETLRNLNGNKTIAVSTLGKCPVRAGDLLVQKGHLLGLASTSVHRSEKYKTVYFANLTVVREELKAIDGDVEFL